MSTQTDVIQDSNEALIHVSSSLLALSVVPLLCIALISYHVNLGLESSILWGASRSFIQFPFFYWGENNAWVVLLYLLFMVLLASLEASSRSKYHFKNVFGYMFLAISVNVTLVSVFAFGVILKPKPLWNPQYVITIVGMLLGNCITGISLAIDSITSSFVEQSLEIELYLSFGASPKEACGRLIRDAVRVSTTPMLNSMAVIGLVSIPGMMTGQILAGSPVLEAARYQMLIIYFIAVTTFGTIITEMWLIQRIAFDGTTEVLKPGYFYRKVSAFQDLKGSIKLLLQSRKRETTPALQRLNQETTQPEYCAVSDSSEISSDSTTSIEFIKALDGKATGMNRTALLEFHGLQRTIERPGKDPLILFDNMSQAISYGDVIFLQGPSGAGKTTLLRMLSRLIPPQDETDKRSKIMLDGHSNYLPTTWRKRVRYVRQNKIDITGTPLETLRYIPTFRSWKQCTSPTAQEMINSTVRFINEFVYLAIALASQPDILLMDESTSALDFDSKLLVERVITTIVSERRMGIVWISHDPEQIDRLTFPTNLTRRR